MNNIFSSEIQGLFKKQLMRQFFICGLLIITSNFISGASYGVNIKYRTYISGEMRVESFRDIKTPFNYVGIKDFASNGYFYMGITYPSSSYIKCFSCGVVVKAIPDTTCQDLHDRHDKPCAFIDKDEDMPPSAYSLEKPEPVEVVATKKPQTATKPQATSPFVPVTEGIPAVFLAEIEEMRNRPQGGIAVISESEHRRTFTIDDALNLDNYLTKISSSNDVSELSKEEAQWADFSGFSKLLQENAESQTGSNEAPASSELPQTATSEPPSPELDRENITYDNIFEKMYLHKRTFTDGEKDHWSKFQDKLIRISPLYLGLTFTMGSDDKSFPEISPSTDEHPHYKFEDGQKLKNMFFDYNIPHLCMSLMLEMDRKLLSTISVINDESHTTLAKSFGLTRLTYKNIDLFRGIKSNRGIKLNLEDVIDDRGELTNHEVITSTDIGALLHVAPRFLLLKDKVTATELLALTNNLTIAFCQKSIINRLYEKLKNECRSYNDDDYYSMPQPEVRKANPFPESKEIAYIASQHICIFYMWSLLGKIKEGKPFPKSVDPQKALKFFSMQHIRECILEAAKSIFSCSIADIQKKLNASPHNRKKVEITKKYIDNYISNFMESFGKSYSLSMTEEVFFSTLFPAFGDLFNTSRIAEKEDSPTICVVCHDKLVKGETEMHMLKYCNHSLDSKCWMNFQSRRIRDCPICRKPIRGTTPYIYGEDIEPKLLEEK